MDIVDDIIQDIGSKMTKSNLQTVEKAVLEQMDDIKNKKTQQGQSPAKGGRWNNRYNRQYANREKGGRRSPVTLRNREERIEKTNVEEGKRGSTIRFRDRKAGEIFFYHDSGTAKGRKFRQVYPDNDNQVPQALDMTAEEKLHEILRE